MVILALDANNLINRAFYAIPLMFARDKTPTNAIRGFCNTLLNLQEQTKADLTIAAFDGGTPPFRKEAAPSYKANRGEKPPELDEQLAICAALVCPALGVPVIKHPGTEADDILFTLALRASEAQHSIWIASGDKDTAQCLDLPETHLLRPPQKSTDPWAETRKETAIEIFGVHPSQIPDYLAITGDSCDNLPGVPGAGPKTAAKWLAEYQNIAGILQNKDKLTPRFQKALDPELLRKNLLVTTAYDTGDKIPQPKNPPETQREFFNELGLHRIANRLTHSQAILRKSTAE